MAKDHYFDITAKLDMMEMKNAVIMAQKELKTRFDFKGVVAEIKLNEAGKVVALSSSSEDKINAFCFYLFKRFPRNISLNEFRNQNIF